jgi:IS30 family transposase
MRFIYLKGISSILLTIKPEKGAIENTNKLIRQYIPKKSNFNEFNYKQIKEIQYKINNRPRAKLNFYSPKEIFFLNLQKQKVALSG